MHVEEKFNKRDVQAVDSTAHVGREWLTRKTGKREPFVRVLFCEKPETAAHEKGIRKLSTWMTPHEALELAQALIAQATPMLKPVTGHD